MNWEHMDSTRFLMELNDMVLYLFINGHFSFDRV